MDMITLATAKNYTDSQRLAYIETGAVYTFNGNSEGKEFNGTQVKIADVAPDLNNLAKVVGLMGGQQLEILKDDFEVVTADGEPQIQYAIYQETAMVSVYKGALWVFCNPESEGYYVTSIEFADTVHPIDPKFIPPVDSLTINGTDGKQYKLTVNNGAISVAEVV